MSDEINLSFYFCKLIPNIENKLFHLSTSLEHFEMQIFKIETIFKLKRTFKNVIAIFLRGEFFFQK